MKGKRLLILGAALALGLSACAQVTTLTRKAPLNAAGDVPSGSWEKITSASDINTDDDFLLGWNYSGTDYYSMGTVTSSGLNTSSSLASAKIVRFETATGGYYIKHTSSDYINNASSTSISLGSKSSVWTIDSNLYIRNTSNANRFLGAASNASTARFKAYASGNESTYPQVFVYKQAASTFGTLHHIKVNAASQHKTTFEVGETFSSNGLVLTGYDGENESTANSENISSGFTTDFDNHTFVAGDVGTNKTVTVTYSGKTTTYSINVASGPEETNVIDAISVATALANNEVTPIRYTITGYVRSIVTEWSSEHNNISFNLSDTLQSSDVIEVFRSSVSGIEGENLEVGDKVNVVGYLTKYNNKPEFASGCATTFIERPTTEYEEPDPENKTLSEFINLPNSANKAYIVTASIKWWKNESAQKDEYGNMVLTDGTNTLVVYGSTYSDDALVWNKTTGLYTFNNPKDFLTNEHTSVLEKDWTVTIKLIRDDYNGQVQGKGIITSVQAPTATSIALSDDSLDLEQGTSVDLTATVVPSSLSSSVVWSIWPEDGKVTVNQNGKVTAAADAVVGAEYTVTAVVGSLDDTCDITVVASSVPADAVTVSKTVAQLKEDNSWVNGGVVNSLTIGKVDVTLTGDNGDTKYYDSGSNLRVYVLKTNGVGSVSFVAKTGYKIISIAITYEWDQNTGSFELDSEEVDVVNDTSVSYAIANSGSKNEQLRITAFTIVYTTDSSADPVEAHLSSATSVATIHGAQNPVSEPTTKSLNFEDIGATNGTKISDTYIGVVKLSGAKGDHQSSVPAFYDDQVRIYAGNTITFESTYEITNIVFNYGSGTFESFNILEGEGTLDGDGWAGSANSVTFKNVSGSQVKLNSVSVTTANSISVDSVKLRFGLTIPKDEWDAIQGISDYGVMVVRKETLVNTYGCSSVEEAYNGGKNVNIFNTGSSEAPYLDGDNYLFTARINMTKVSNYNVVFCAAPFVVVNGQYHFLEEKEASVYSLAQYYLDNGGSEYLPNEALSLLSGRLGD